MKPKTKAFTFPTLPPPSSKTQHTARGEVPLKPKSKPSRLDKGLE